MERNTKESKKLVREMDGFLCAYPGCTKPYLEYHHFDPPWSVEQHNRPEGVIALCPDHHRHADGGAFTVAQMHEFKKEARVKFAQIKGQFEWLRSSMGVLAGGMLGVNNDIDILINKQPFLWFSKDSRGYKLLNIQLAPYVVMTDNAWEVHPDSADIECHPQGKTLKIKLDSTRYFNIYFNEYESLELFSSKNSNFKHTALQRISFPLVLVEIEANIPELRMKLKKGKMELGDGNVFSGMIIMNNGNGINLNI